MNELQIGMGKSARRGYRLADLSIQPSRRTRTPAEVDTSWQIDALRFDSPIVADPSDGVVSPQSAIEMSRAGALGVLHSEGVWCRHDDPTAALADIAAVDPLEDGAADRVLTRIRELGRQPVRPELIKERVAEMRAGGATVALAVTPGRVEGSLDDLLAAEPDLLVIEGTVVSAEHLADGEPLNLKRVLRRLEVPAIVGGCTSYSAALHLMRTGAAGVLVGFGGGAAHTTRTSLGIHAPIATAVADVAAARRDYMDESGGRYVHVIADGAVGRSGDLVKAIACGADAVMLGAALARAEEAPGRGWHWGHEAHHQQLPRGERVEVGTVAPLAEILNGPGRLADGTTNLMGALRRAMATTGYSDLKEFQRVEVVVSPYQPM